MSCSSTTLSAKLTLNQLCTSAGQLEFSSIQVSQRGSFIKFQDRIVGSFLYVRPLYELTRLNMASTWSLYNCLHFSSLKNRAWRTVSYLFCSTLICCSRQRQAASHSSNCCLGHQMVPQHRIATTKWCHVRQDSPLSSHHPIIRLASKSTLPVISSSSACWQLAVPAALFRCKASILHLNWGVVLLPDDDTASSSLLKNTALWAWLPGCICPLTSVSVSPECVSLNFSQVLPGPHQSTY